MKNTSTIFLLFAGVLILTGTMPIQAVTTGSAFPANASNHLRLGGQIADLDLNSMTVAIGGTTYTLSSLVKIHSDRGETLTKDNLRKNMTVRFHHTAPEDGGPHPVITEIEVISSQ